MLKKLIININHSQLPKNIKIHKNQRLYGQMKKESTSSQLHLI